MPAPDPTVITSPVTALPDLHLLAVENSPEVHSLLYVPIGGAPALARDVFRIDRLPRTSAPLDAILENWLTQYRTAFDPGGVAHRVVVRRADEFIVDAGFVDHPLLGQHRQQLRFVRGARHDYGIELIHKDDPLAEPDVAERIAFLGTVDAAGLSAERVPTLTPFAAAAHDRSARLHALMLQAADARDTRGGPHAELQSMPGPELGALLVGASPFHRSEVWANIARFYGRNVVIDGLIDEFDTAAACLRAAVWILHDRRAEPFLHRLLYDVAENLADVLMLTYGDARRSNIARAAGIYRTLPDGWGSNEAARAFRADILSGFGMVLQDPDATTPFMARLTAKAQTSMRAPAIADAAFDHLMEYSSRVSYIARRKNRALFGDACLAADVAQMLAERAYGSEPNQTADVARTAQAFQAQLECQLGLWGMTQADLDRAAGAFRARFRRAPESRAQLVLLRPLATSRRLKIANRFEPYYEEVLSPIVPDTLTIESVLHLAFMKHFDTHALGGPIDIFGMARSTALGTFAGGLESWRTAAHGLIRASSLVLALFDETEALQWEMEELSRQHAFGKTIFVVPPSTAPTGTVLYPQAAMRRLRAVGFQFPDDVHEPGFVVFAGSGAVARRLPFDALWSGELLDTVWPPPTAV